ncbi:MAG: hypothetical protein P4L39_02780 [Humidesulfovibrio sp.]|nr:hypothetical protein [Humidesulfovibrio sp.]
MESGTLIPLLRQRAENVWQKLRLRRREPWNWLVQNASLALLPPGLLFHSPSLIVLSLLGAAAGCLKLPLPPMQHTELRRLLPTLERLIGQESVWLAKPIDRRKKRQVWFLCAGAPLAALFLWLQDLGPIGLAIAVFFLLHVRRKNIEQGIDP